VRKKRCRTASPPLLACQSLTEIGLTTVGFTCSVSHLDPSLN
jgi:hypothetical protein